jgi:hypothetical protein
LKSQNIAIQKVETTMKEIEEEKENLSAMLA